MQMVQLYKTLLFGELMKPSISKTPRRGLMGNKPMGVVYMPEVYERARRMKVATKEDATDPRQLRLPYPPPYNSNCRSRV